MHCRSLHCEMPNLIVQGFSVHWTQHKDNDAPLRIRLWENNSQRRSHGSNSTHWRHGETFHLLSVANWMIFLILTQNKGIVINLLSSLFLTITPKKLLIAANHAETFSLLFLLMITTKRPYLFTIKRKKKNVCWKKKKTVRKVILRIDLFVFRSRTNL